MYLYYNVIYSHILCDIDEKKQSRTNKTEQKTDYKVLKPDKKTK